jgi:predicted transcriptional regulator of viral defense system
VILPDYLSVSLYYWSKSVLEIGVTKQTIDDYTVRIYDLEKSVCDAVKFRNKIGIDLSSEIVKNYLKRTDRNLTRLNEYAKRMRLASTMNSLIDYWV